MTEDMKVAWLEIEQMLGEPTREEFDVFLRTWQRAVQATRKTLAEQPAQRPWVGLTDEERNYCVDTPFVSQQWVNIEAKLRSKNT